jgi:hypothetical protein
MPNIIIKGDPDELRRALADSQAVRASVALARFGEELSNRLAVNARFVEELTKAARRVRS